MTAAQLAREVIAVLDLQQTYFRTRTPEALRESKSAERCLRKRCTDIISPPAAERRGLFDAAPEPERPAGPLYRCPRCERVAPLAGWHHTAKSDGTPHLSKCRACAIQGYDC
ncbi:MAG: hypothetical protein K2P78_14540 [Gemmataceae bacterium]|nr:hypothetical protein [Gemmataceae bacterium]